MPIALNPKTNWNYVLKSDRDLPEDQQTVFHLAHLEVDELAEVEDSLVSTDLSGGIDSGVRQARISLGSQTNKTLRLGLKGWTNFKDENGNVVVWPDGGQGRVNVKKLNVLSSAHRRELAEAILEGQKVTPHEGN